MCEKNKIWMNFFLISFGLVDIGLFQNLPNSRKVVLGNCQYPEHGRVCCWLCWASIPNCPKTTISQYWAFLFLVLLLGLLTVSSFWNCCWNPSIITGLATWTWHWYWCEVLAGSYQCSVNNLMKERWTENGRRHSWRTKEKRKKTENNRWDNE